MKTRPEFDGTNHTAVFVACECGWLRVCDSPHEATAAASTHAALHRILPRIQATTAATRIRGRLTSEAEA